MGGCVRRESQQTLQPAPANSCSTALNLSININRVGLGGGCACRTPPSKRRAEVGKLLLRILVLAYLNIAMYVRSRVDISEKYMIRNWNSPDTTVSGFGCTGLGMSTSTDVRLHE